MSTILIGSVIFLGLYLITAYFISDHSTKGVVEEEIKSSYRLMSFGLTFLAFFMMWLVWISVYMHQLNPLIAPNLIKEILETHHS